MHSGRQALLVLVYLGTSETFAEGATGFGVSTTRAWRHVGEVIALLAAPPPVLSSRSSATRRS
ncbi:transposase family protein [Actinomadura scrupuli]|uniref:transposase family protein n=1 Tax=Actinomadura scrupuli TaxID=559629 RepID=UPI003D98E16A